ncbi:hypothetical protein ASU31_11265 [Pedobacter ginsenosidimutans]|uniref:Uncharacterized protein n=1 Tax=Pedobacter ginsenosidimutans TaxID=687842 RepID=A0A0T5VQJ3_9SPHI|nr:hypothetical protein ASU31_11265 [Pedobacter ginsenosidimutans]
MINGKGTADFRISALNLGVLRYLRRSKTYECILPVSLFALKSLIWFKIIRKAIVVLVGFGAPAFRFNFFIAVIFERNRHCEKAFSADEAILKRSLLVCALRLLRRSSSQ